MDLPTLRSERGWSQADLAALLHVSVPMISLIESGARSLPPRRAEQIAALCGLPEPERAPLVGALILAHRRGRSAHGVQ